MVAEVATPRPKPDIERRVCDQCGRAELEVRIGPGRQVQLRCSACGRWVPVWKKPSRVHSG